MLCVRIWSYMIPLDSPQLDQQIAINVCLGEIIKTASVD